MNDLIKALRQHKPHLGAVMSSHHADEAADRIEKLEADNKRLREVLAPLIVAWVDFKTKQDGHWGNHSDAYYTLVKYLYNEWESASKALEDKDA